MTAEIIDKAYLNDKAKADYVDYSVHVIEDRAIYAKLDGLKPVARRLLWAAHTMGLRHTGRFTKSAKVVGETIGNYHPHGDQACYGALVTAANQIMPLFDASGNWGTMTDPPAAQRYTECRLSKYADSIFFDKFYINAIPKVPNYDDSAEEPLILPTLLPNALINGNFGIAPGVRTLTPTFTLKSVAKTLIEALKAGKATAIICQQNLEMVTEYGGVLRKTSATKKELLDFYKTGKGKFTFDSVYEDDSKKNAIRFNAFAPIGNLDGTYTKKKGYKPGLLDKIAEVKGVNRVRDDSSVEDRFNAYVIEFNKTLKGTARDAAIKRVCELFSGNQTFNVQVVDRKPGVKKLEMTTVPNMINHWLAYRISLEKTACTYWIDKRNIEINYLKLMRLAVKNRRFIIQALDKKYNDEQLANYIAKGLKITVDQANTILDLKIRQLKALEDQVLVDKIKKLEKEIAEYKQRIAKPKAYIARNIIDITKELLK